MSAQKLRDQREVETKVSEDATVSKNNADDMAKLARDEIPLRRKNTALSLASDIIEQRMTDHGCNKEENLSLPYLFMRMGKLNSAGWKNFTCGVIAAACESGRRGTITFSDFFLKTVSGMAYPAYGVVFAKGITAFSELDAHQRRHDGDRVALWLFLIAIGSMLAIGIQTYMFSSTAATLTAKLRSLSFKAILRQDGEFRCAPTSGTG